jgi:hypothetical protein
MERNQFTFYRSYYEAVRELPKKEQSAVMLAICAYALDEEEPSLTGTAKAIFSLVRPTLDASRRKAISGKSGGERKQNESKTEANRKQTEREKENKKENKKKKEYKSNTPIPLFGVFEEFSGGDSDLLSALIAFESMREKIKKPMSEDAKKRLVAKLQRLSSDKAIWIAILNQSEDHCWSDVYELKSNGPREKPKNPNNMAGMNFQATPERVKKNGEWLDKFLEEQAEKEA